MPLSWNELKARAVRFSNDWAGAQRERAEAQTFWNEFFDVFGVHRRTVASFEEPVRGLRGSFEFIDLLWKGTLLAEHKSRGRDLGRAHLQAIDYIQALMSEGRADEIPRYVVVSDFARIALHDLEAQSPPLEFELRELHRHAHAFGFIAGYRQEVYQEVYEDQDPINIRAVRVMGELHDALESGGYSGHDLERLLVRILFCLFAEDTGIFDQPGAFEYYIEHHTSSDGSDLGPQLARLFEILNTPPERRQANLLEELRELPYVNGDLFAERLPLADFNSEMRNALLGCTRFRWREISPAIFGSMFQAVMEARERRQIGGHYTSERDILKVVRSLFLDELQEEFERVRSDRRRLTDFHRKLGTLRLLDPACGCGNFLIIAYRELRRLEIEVLKALHGTGQRQQFLDVKQQLQVDVDQMYGIEIQEWPARIAEVALWLMDHQMNQEVSEIFGEYVLRLPLTKSPRIAHANALRIDWRDVLPVEHCSYILGNPPFVGTRFLTNEQKQDMAAVVPELRSRGILDYVTGWYFKAAEYIRGTITPTAFVSTNSITQGEQVGVLWGELYRRGMSINFAHRTFEWESEAEGQAHVHVVIIGFGAQDRPNKRIYDYEAGGGGASVTAARSISPYLVEGGNTVVTSRARPLCDAPLMRNGNQPIDDGNYIFTPEEKREFLAIQPEAEPFFRQFVGSEEFINGIERWFLWLGGCPPAKLRTMPAAMERMRRVRSFRARSSREATQALASTPTRLSVETLPEREYLVVPLVSSERRRYIPMDFVGPDVMISNLCSAIPNATLYHFGVLSSAMHMAWVSTVCGRLESRYRYSKNLVYNNFPWPSDIAPAQRTAVEAAAKGVLDARARFPDATFADLYDPLAMPRELSRAHAALDRVVDRLYRSQPFPDDRRRVEQLFAAYERLTAPLLPAETRRGRRRRNQP